MRFSLLYEIQKRKPWAETTNEDVYREAVEQIVLADQLGWDGVWVVEHHFLPEFSHSSRPDIFLGYLAARTSRIRLGHGVVVLPSHHPVRVAEGIATLDILSNGRVEFGTGRGLSPLELSGFGIDPYYSREMWEESLSIIPKIWEAEIFEYQGQFWKIPPRPVLPKPVQKPHPPIWMAVTQPDSFRIAGERGIGAIVLSVGEPGRLVPLVSTYREAIDRAKPVGAFVNNQCGVFVLGLCGDDADEAIALASDGAKWYFGVNREYTRDFARDWGSLDNVPESYRWYAQQAQRKRDIKSVIAPLSPQEMAERAIVVAGDPHRCLEAVKRYQEVGIDELIIAMQIGAIPHDRIMRSIELFSREVISKVRAGDPSASGRGGG